MDGLLKTAPDKEKARSILKMAGKTIEMIEGIDVERFPSNVTKEYYDVIREMISVIMLLDGCKTYGEGAHKTAIEYLQANYGVITSGEISMIDDLRIVRNRISYDGFFVHEDYIRRKTPAIGVLISKLEGIARRKL